MERDGLDITISIFKLLGGMVLAFFAAAFGSFFTLAYFDALMGDHDGQAGIGFALLALIIGVASAIITASVIALRFWRRYSAPEPW
jgi:hypothetical protein